jgi:hypothetical protein
MTSSLKRRIEQLERLTPVGAEVERAHAIVRAYDMVQFTPEQATDEDRALVAATSHEDRWRAFGILIDAGGGLEAAVRASYELKTER